MEQAENQPTALPLGLEIVHNGQELCIQKLLSSSGWTSEVYLGELALDPEPVPVAVKVMKALDLPMARQLFEQEGLSLAAMAFHEEEANKEQRLSLKVAPLYYGRFEYNDMPCLVMEFVSGESIPSLLEKSGRLPEPQALTIAWHLYRTLDILHTRLKKTYIDLKFENLWWVQGEDGERSQLKLLDFGTLEDIKAGDLSSRGVRRDLLLGGVYLCGMLTGYMLDYSLGELRERADPLINRTEMSWGTSQLLRRLLHRSPQVRPSSAAAVASELRTLVNYWEQPVDRLYEIADTNLARAMGESDTQGARAREHASRARAALDLVKLQPGYDEQRLENAIRRVEDVLLQSDYVTRGRALFNGRTYGDARQIFEEGMHWSDRPAELRRWAYLARVGQDVAPQVFDQHREAAVEALNRLNEENWPAARERLEALKPAIDSPGLEYLLADCRLFASLEQAEAASRSENYGEAAESYRQALASLEMLPDADFIQKEEIGDLRSAAERMEQLQATRGQARGRMEQAALALEREQDDQVVDLAWQAYGLDWQDDMVQRSYAQLLGQASRAGRLYTSLRLAEIGLRRLPAAPELAAHRNQAWLLWQSMQAAQRGDYLSFGLFLRSLYASPELMKLETTLPAIQKQLDQAGKKATQARDPAGMRQVADICETVTFPGHDQWAESLRQAAHKISEEQEQAQRQAVDRMVGRAMHLINLDHPQQAAELWPEENLAQVQVHFQERFEESNRLLQDAAIIAARVGYRQEEIADLQERLQARQSAILQADSYRQQLEEQDQSTRMADLQRRWEELQAAHQALLSQPASGKNLALQRQELEDFQSGLIAFIEKGYAYLNRHNQEEATIRQRIEWAVNALDMAGEEAWKELQGVSIRRLAQLQEQMGAAQKLFASGELARAAAAVDSLQPQYGTTPEWLALKGRIVQALAWQAWQEDRRSILDAGQVDHDLLDALGEYAVLDLPRVYRYSSRMENYFEKARASIKQRVEDDFDHYKTPQFFELLQRWKKLEQTAALFERGKNHDAA